MRSVLFVVLLFAVLALVKSHGYIRDPIARTSIQLRPEFGAQQPFWWDHQGVWCGNVLQDPSYSRCGRCGDTFGQTTANQNGIFDKGIIVRNYTAGSIINVVIGFGAAHGGQFELELCPQQVETDNCFQRLQIIGGTDPIRDNRMCVNFEDRERTARVQLPPGVRCNRCTLRWTYRTHYFADPWDPAWQPCDFRHATTQAFRNCADIRIT